MADSAAISAAFYAELGPAGLAERTTLEWDQAILARLAELIRPGDRVADIGCGYGRIAIPLALRQARVTGLDLSAGMLAAARVSAMQLGVEVDWVQASMCQTPLVSGAFDVVLCLWSAFYELLERSEQQAALGEMHRLLRPGGWGLIEGPVYTDPTAEELATGRRYGPEGRLAADSIAGMLNLHYRQDAASWQELLSLAGIERYQLEVSEWGGRPRQLLRFWA